MSIIIYILLAFGAFSGTIARHFSSTILFDGSQVVGILSINLIGSFVLALLYAATCNSIKFKEEYTQMLGAGFLGSFTTYSAFTKEVYFFISNSQVFYAIGYTISSTVLGLLFALVGYQVGKGFSNRVQN